MLEKLIALNLSLLILGQAWLFRLHVGTWIFPACIYGLFWFGYTFFPLIIVPGAEINAISILYILSSCLIFSFSSLAFKWEQAFLIKKINKNKYNYNSKFLNVIFFSFGILVISATIINWKFQGIIISDIFRDLLSVSNEYTGKRYSNDLTDNVYRKISIALLYPTAIIGGILYASSEKLNNRVAILVISMATSIFMMVVEGNKGAIFLSISLFWAGTLINKLNNGRFDLISIDTIKNIIIILPLIVVLTAVSFISRGIDIDNSIGSIIDKLIYYFSSYSSGHIFAFSDWFSFEYFGTSIFHYNSIENSNGHYTFEPIFTLIGSNVILPHGVYEEYFSIGNILQTNIYTHYRGLIHDFGMLGSLLIIFIGGLIVHLAFYRLLFNPRSFVSISIFVHFIGYVYTSFIVSLLIWNSVYISFLIICFVLRINNNFSKLRKYSN